MALKRTFGYVLALNVLAVFAFVIGSPTQTSATYSQYSDYKSHKDYKKRRYEQSHSNTTVDIDISHSSYEKHDKDKDDELKNDDENHKDYNYSHNYKKHRSKVRRASTRTGYTPRTSYDDRCCNCCDICSEPDILGDDTEEKHKDDGQGSYEEPVNDPGEKPEEETENTILELRIDQQVKVDGEEYVDAETDESSPEGVVGGGAMWQITVSADEADPDESRDIKVQWQPPGNVDLSRYEATSGSYNGFEWTVNISELPAILTVDSTINSGGLGMATATISHIACTDAQAVDGFCKFTDNVNANNSNPAGVMAIASVNVDSDGGVLGAATGGQGGDVGGQVLGTDSGGTVLAATGVSAHGMLAVGLLIMLSPVVLFATSRLSS